MTSASAFCTPSLLDCLPPNDRDRLRPALQLVTLAEGQDLYRTGQAVHSVYFPVTALVEEVLPQPDGGALVLRRLAAQAMAGSCVLGDARATRTARVCGAGLAYKMEYADFVSPGRGPCFSRTRDAGRGGGPARQQPATRELTQSGQLTITSLPMTWREVMRA